MVDKPTERAIRLIEYLAALARINSKIIRSVEEYKSILWVHTIPHEPKHCFCQAWGEEDEHGEDVWIEIKKMKEPKIPSVPEICRDWVDFQTLRNTSDIPELRQTIQVENEKLDTDTGEKISVSETVSLANFPEVKKTWDEYLEERWLPWTEIYNRYDKVQKVYADLFHIYQVQLERMGIRSVAEESTIGVCEHEQEVDQEDNNNGEEQTISEEFSEEEDLEPDDVPEEEVERVGEYQETHPKSIYEALRVKSHIFGRIVIESLRERPNNSCMRESMPTYILKKWNVKTRGFYNGPQNLDSEISYTWEIKGGGPSGTNAKEVSAFI